MRLTRTAEIASGGSLALGKGSSYRIMVMGVNEEKTTTVRLRNGQTKNVQKTRLVPIVLDRGGTCTV